jgi:hypothetical protein
MVNLVQDSCYFDINNAPPHVLCISDDIGDSPLLPQTTLTAGSLAGCCPLKNLMVLNQNRGFPSPRGIGATKLSRRPHRGRILVDDKKEIFFRAVGTKYY